MKRLMGSIFLLLAVCGISHAGGFIVPQYTYQTGVSSITTVIITVSTQGAVAPGATQMDNPQVANRVATEIQNIDATANLWCLPVSTMPVVNGGRKITPGSTWVVSFLDIIYPGTPAGGTNLPVKFWCLSDGAAVTKAAVTQAY